MRFLVIGNGQPAREVLKAALGRPGAAVAALVTAEQPGAATRAAAEAAGVPVFDEACLRDSDGAARLAETSPDWLVCASTTRLVPAAILRLVEGRAINMHTGPLPAYAGLHVHQWGIRNGETRFAATIHYIDDGIDTGAIIAAEEFPINPNDTGLSLFKRTISTGTRLLEGVMEQLCRGEIPRGVPQAEGRRRLYRHRDALDPRIDWQASARQVTDFVRAGNYAPLQSPTYTAVLDPLPGWNIQVLEARPTERPADALPGQICSIGATGPLIACGDGAVILSRAANDGKKMDEAAWGRYVDALPTARMLSGIRPPTLNRGNQE